MRPTEIYNHLTKSVKHQYFRMREKMNESNKDEDHLISTLSMFKTYLRVNQQRCDSNLSGKPYLA